MRARHLVHVAPSFAPGGAQVRVCQLMNHFGAEFRHTVLCLDGNFSARQRLDEMVSLDCVPVKKSTNPASMAARFAGLLRRFQPDLVLTYNWGVIDAVTAVALMRCCPVIHTEDGFGPEESARQLTRRVLYRRLVLQGAHTVVAISHTLERLMRDTWRLPESKLRFISNGIDVRRFTPATRQESPIVVGSAGHLRPEKRYQLLIELCASVARHRPLELRIAGDGSERTALEVAAAAVPHLAVRFLGHQDNIASFYRQIDVFAMTSSTEQMPIAVLEAMASGLPVVSTDVGDIREMVSEENRPFIVPKDALEGALTQLTANLPLRRALGASNRKHCAAVHSIDRMFHEYESLYSNALGCPDPADASARYASW